MGKKLIRYDVDELAWVNFNVSMDETDYEEFLNYLDLHDIAMFEAFKDISFDMVVDIINGDAEDIKFMVKSRWSDNVYTTSVYEVIEDWMRDKAYENGINDYGDSIERNSTFWVNKGEE